MMRRTSLLLLLLVLGLRLGAQTLSVPRKEPDMWLKVLQQGGLLRQDNWFVNFDQGLVGTVLGMNFVDGYTWGFHEVKLGRVFGDCSRLEIEPRLMWGMNRHVWIGKGAVRYHMTPSKFGYVEINGGKWTEDFDKDPVLSETGNSFFSGLFGWNHGLIYERTNVELKGSIGLTGVLQGAVHVSWEQRELMENHRERGLSRRKGRPNIPSNYLVPPSALTRGVAPQTRWRLWTAGVQLDYVPGRKIMAPDDMTFVALTSLPTFSLKVDGGFNAPKTGEANRGFLSMDVSASQARTSERGWSVWKWFAAVGGFVVRKDVDLMDFRHFDAQAYTWGERKDLSPYDFSSRKMGDLTQFALLKNYELSTDRWWVEAHGEWNMDNMGLSEWLMEAGITDYVQLHVVKVDGAPLHSELSYVIDLVSKIRIGVGFGLDDGRWDGAAFILNARL